MRILMSILLLICFTTANAQPNKYWWQLLRKQPSGGGGGGCATRVGVLIYTNFENTADPFAPWHNTQHCCDYSITQSNAIPARLGTYSMRVDLFRTDPTVAASKRAEINESVSEPLNSERWVGCSYYFPSATYVSDQDPELIQQWHTDAPTGSPPMSLLTWNGVIYTNHAINPAGGATVDNSYFTQVAIAPIVYDQWIDIVVRYKQAADATGIIQVWVNGVLKYTYNGPDTFPPYQNYFKIGINKWPWMPNSSWGGTQNQRLFYIDELRLGDATTNLFSMSPGVCP